MNLKSNTIFRSLSVFTYRDKRNLVAVTALQILMSFIDLIGVALVGVLSALAVNGVQSKEPGNRVGFVLNLLQISEFDFEKQVAILGVVAGTLLIGRTLISIIFTRRTLYFLSRKSAQVTSRLVADLLSQDLLFIQKKSSQQNLFALTSGVSHITVGVVGTTIMLIADLSLLVVMSGGLLFLDPALATLTFGLFLAIGLMLYLLMHKRAQRLGRENSEMQVSSNELILESLETFRELVVRNRREYYAGKIAAEREMIARNSAEMAFMPNIGKYVIETSVVFGAMAIAAIQFITEDATRAIGTLAIFLAAGSRIAPAVLRLQQGAIAIKTSLASALPTLDLMQDLDDQKISKYDLNNPPIEISTFSSDIRMNNVHFNYPERDTDVLRGVNLLIKSGSSIALVGPSGAGKSTTADLILGVLEPTRGEITIGGYPPSLVIRELPGVVGYVPQSIKIINGSVKENVCLGYEPSDFSDKDVWDVLQKAKLADYIESLEFGIHTHVGEAGSKLSGGQRQRLGIARALVTDPKILVLDEATSALDGRTESDITNALQLLRGEVTIVTIAHRLSTVINADEVIYIKNGAIEAKGTFTQVESLVPEFAEIASGMSPKQRKTKG